MGSKIKTRFDTRMSGGKSLVSGLSGDLRTLTGDIVERFDFDTSVPKSLPQIAADTGKNIFKTLTDATKRFAANNRRGLK